MSQTGHSIYEAWKAGHLEWAINQGIIRTSVITYCKLYDTYKRHRDAGLNYLQAVEKAADEMSTSTDTVRRAIAEVI